MFLLIEDDSYKARRISSFLCEKFPDLEVVTARSVTTGLKRLSMSPFPDAVLLDMSLSTFDVGPKETGGRPQNFGGIAVLEHMVRRKVEIPVIVITQFQTFPKNGMDVGLEEIKADLSDRFAAIFKGIIFYSSREAEWEQALESSVAQILERGQ